MERRMTHTIILHRMNEDNFFDITRPLHGTVFPGLPEFDMTQNLSPADKVKVSNLRGLRQHLSKIFLLARDGETTAGWSWGYQSMDEEFYMCNSAVMPEYRRKGIYKSLLDKMIDEAANEGFQVITSKHHVGNNAIIIPKLQRDFRIVGTELDLRFGLFVKLAYFVNSDSAKVYAYRSGSTAYDDQLGNLIKT